MKWASAIAQHDDLASAVAACARSLEVDLGGPADLVVVFPTAHHRPAFDELPHLVAARFPGACLVGCSASGAIAAGREIERGAAVSMTAAALPGVTLTPLRWTDGGPPPPEDAEATIILADPFSCDPAGLVEALDEGAPRVRKVGGLASGGEAAGDCALFLGPDSLRDGAVGVALSGDVSVETTVAQGCRPVGQPLAIGSCERNIVRDLGGRRPLDVMRELYASLGPADQELFRSALQVGLEMNGGSLEFRPDDVLVRNLVGVDPDSGAVAIGGVPRQWQVMTFMVRDGQTADQELERLLAAPRPQPAGALLFSCTGRGEGLFGVADHDSGLFARRFGPVPLGGFFCNGEIGPIGGRTFVHGYTSCFALFRSR